MCMGAWRPGASRGAPFVTDKGMYCQKCVGGGGGCVFVKKLCQDVWCVVRWHCVHGVKLFP